ncbi:MAG: exodeoxyribonuclease VII large subunit [Kiritimatiellae bacterium]|nr:exodeoxyribonuclease VII large subunit [Kiritimatiellia bacterium]
MAEKYPEYTVSSLTARLKGLLEGDFSGIVVEGEISGWRRYPSGHSYFTLKDDGAQISCVMFAGSFESCCMRHPELRDGLKDGAKVKLFGGVSVYAARGNYQLIVRSAKLAGLGDLMQRYMELKSRLEKEGLFDASRKRELPTMPRRIGIVTSEAGAVIHDMCTVLTRRFPNLEIRLFPSLVQGAEAPKTIIAGIEYFNGGCDDFAADLLIVARGGGSFEDLFCFNDEELVRAVAASRIPTISAVGHETDYTLCDFAADRRAGTPSIAAEMAVPVMEDLRAALASHASRLVASLRSTYEYNAQRVDHLSEALAPALEARVVDFAHRLEKLASALAPALEARSVDCAHRVETLSRALASSVAFAFAKREAHFSQIKSKLELLSPYSVLKRGYSLTTDASGAVVKSSESLKSGDVLMTRFAKGDVTSVVR